MSPCEGAHGRDIIFSSPSDRALPSRVHPPDHSHTQTRHTKVEREQIEVAWKEICVAHDAAVEKWAGRCLELKAGGVRAKDLPKKPKRPPKPKPKESDDEGDDSGGGEGSDDDG
ncbi:hypothetical protein FB451DRAFT_1183395 [Mycena latifolia]|nr:hypothetical protein FB451DRAFT_1465835 [Mycena latifolia]KAJ7457494.1 hypothetical protein FB451DRAFT_1183395 [Mycena latifolia]